MGLRTVLGVAAATVLLAGCQQDAPAETVEAICEQVFDCGGWGWSSRSECEDGFLDSASHFTECIDADGYLACVYEDECLTLDCDGFADCESQCWRDRCEQLTE